MKKETLVWKGFYIGSALVSFGAHTNLALIFIILSSLLLIASFNSFRKSAGHSIAFSCIAFVSNIGFDIGLYYRNAIVDYFFFAILIWCFFGFVKAENVTQ